MKRILTTALLTLGVLFSNNVISEEMTCMALDCVTKTTKEMEKNIENLHSSISKEGLRFYLIDKKLKIEIPTSMVYNEVDKRSTLKVKANEIMSKVTDFTSKYPEAKVTIIGHTGLNMEKDKSLGLTKLQAHGLALNYYHKYSFGGVPTYTGKGNIDNHECSKINNTCNDRIDIWIENIIK